MLKYLTIFLIPLQAFALGNLFIIGGGKQPDQLVTSFLELCGKDKSILVVAKASSYEAEVIQETAKRFNDLGAKNVKGYRCDTLADDCLSQLEGIRCVYFSGGDQKKLTTHFASTQSMNKLHQIFTNGGTLAGTSAGAAIMSEVMLSGNILDDSTSFSRIANSHVEHVKGFGFLKDFIIDQHFIKRKRQNRLLSKVLEMPSLVGVGIDESTAIVFKNSLTDFHVLGEASVMVYDARKAENLTTDASGNFNGSDIKLSILISGGQFKF